MKSLILCLSIILSSVFCFGQNPTLVKDIYTGSTTSGIQEMVRTSNLAFFNAYEFNNDFIRGLFRTDGTAAGTYKINFQSPGYTYGKAEKITALGDKVIFAGNNYSKNGEIWVSDGTLQGTVLLDRLQPTANIIPVIEIVAMGSHVYYTAVDNNNNTVLKKTDGTLSGTTTVFDFGTILNMPQVGLLKPINGILYFTVYDINGTGFDQLWRTDGTAAGTYLVKNFGTGNSVASKPMQAGGFFYIMVVEAGVGNVLWKSDGTTAGTSALKVISSRPQDLSNNIYPSFAAMGSTLYFAGLNESGMELWKTDGTSAGTTMALDMNPSGSTNPSSLTVLNDQLYFGGNVPGFGVELCRYDGTTGFVVADINYGTGNGFSSSSGMEASNGVLLFSGYTADSGWELWMSDGMETTAMVADLDPGPGVGGAGLLTPGNPVFFTGSKGIETGFELFKFDNAAGLSGLHKVYVNDNSLTGDQFVTAVGNDANAGSVSSPLATISHAISIANIGDTIIVDAGSYEGQILINKRVSIRGAGKTLTKILEPSGSLVGANLEGGFNETALILASEGLEDISIENLGLMGTGNFNADHGILLQSTGQVLNCAFDKLKNGIFFRDAINVGTTALVKGNDMKGLGFVGVNFQGDYMRATLIENNIDLTGSTFGMGVIAGGDSWILEVLEAFNNNIVGFNGWGFKLNSSASTLEMNSIVGTAGYAIQQERDINVELYCNWFGTSNLNDILKKIQGRSLISSILSNGTDADPLKVGFQIDESNCTEPPPQFYVNDNSSEGDKFTYALGDDNNPGTKEAPFATVGKALSVMAQGDYVFVDAGTYAERVFFGKDVNVIGAGANLVRFVWPTTVEPAFVVNNIPYYSQFDSYNGGATNPANVVNISGITIDGENRVFNEKAFVHGIRFHNASGTIENCVFKNFQNPGVTDVTFKTDRAVYFLSDATSPAEVNFSNNKIENFYNFGLLGEGGGLSLTAIKNEIIGNGISTIRQRGVAVNYIKNTRIENNTFTNISSNSNSFAGSAFGIATPSVFKNNLVLNSNSGFLLTDCSLSIEGNELLGSQLYGFYLQGTTGTSNMTLLSNKINGSQIGIFTSIANSAKLNVDLQQNSISNASVKNIINNGGPNITANCNWFGFSDLNSIYGSITGAASVYSWLTNGTDALPDTRGFQITDIPCETAPTAFYVNDNSTEGDVLTDAIGNDNNPGTKELPLATVKKAMELALPGNTIHVDAGEYSEQVLIRKALTIRGAGRDKTNFHFPQNMVLNYLTSNGVTTSNNYAIFHAQDVTGVTIQNIAVDGDNANFSLGRLYGISLQRSSGTVNGCEVRNFKNPNTVSPANATGSGIIGINFAQPVRNIEVYDNIVKDFHYSGIIMSGPTVNYQVYNNTIEGNGSSEFYQNGIEAYGGNGSVKNNTISNIAEFTAFDAQEAAGIAVGANAGAIEISGNRISNAEAGIIFGNRNHVLKNNEISGSLAYGILGYASGNTSPILTIENNILTDNPTSLYFENFGTGNLTAEVHNNSITGSIINSFRNVNATVNASCNWFGVITKQEIEFYVNGTVNFTPWLTDGEDTDIAMVGFQPLEGTCTGKPFSLSLVSQTDVVKCGDDPTGAIDVTIEGGVGPLDIQWTKQDDPTFNASTTDLAGITKGVYDLLVTDANGETLSLQVDLKGPETLAAEVYAESAYCYGEASGRLLVLPYGGTPDQGGFYGILWSDGSILEDRQNVTPGIYSVTITDVNGCTANYNDIAVADPAPIVPIMSATEVLCNGGSTGTALVSASGGTLGVLDEFSTYTYLWSNGATTASVTGLPAGNYTVTVSDDYDCKVIASVTVLQPAALGATIQATNVLCAGESNGSVTVSATGGRAPYQYAADNGSFGSANVLGGLSSGPHTIRVRDNNNCDYATIVNIGTPLAISITTPTVVATCLGSSTGSITLTASGGTGNLRYSWTGPNGYSSNKAAITGLAAGSYTLTVTDANNCTKSTTVIVPVASALTISGTVTNVGCFGAATGVISLTSPSASLTGITYSWTGPNNYRSTSRSIGALRAGIYTVTVKQGSCSYIQSFTVSQPAAALSMTLSKVDITTCGGSGTINVATTTGGTAPYQYSLNNGAFQTAPAFTVTAAATYSVRVRDANGCLFSASITVSDTGNDPYEPNNKQTAAVAYTMNSGNINARIAPTSTDIDWYKFTAKAITGLTHTVTISHPSIRYGFDLYDSRARLVTPTSSTAGLVAVKRYTNLVAGTVYSLRIQGSLSLVCYQLSITDGTSLPAVNPIVNTIASASIDTKKTISVVNQLEASVVPNPHPGQFKLTVLSPSTGMGEITLMTAGGQIISQRKLQLNKGSNTIHYENINPGMLIYRVTLNGMQTTGRIIGVN